MICRFVSTFVLQTCDSNASLFSYLIQNYLPIWMLWSSGSCLPLQHFWRAYIYVHDFWHFSFGYSTTIALQFTLDCLLCNRFTYNSVNVMPVFILILVFNRLASNSATVMPVFWYCYVTDSLRIRPIKRRFRGLIFFFHFFLFFSCCFSFLFFSFFHNLFFFDFRLYFFKFFWSPLDSFHFILAWFYNSAKGTTDTHF